MRKTVLHTGLLLLVILTLHTCAVRAQLQQAADQNQFPGITAVPATADFPGFAATPIDSRLPGTAPSPLGSRPLSGTPSVLALPHREPGEVSAADDQVISAMRADLSQAAVRSGFDISDAAWHYQQVLCSPLPDYILLAFHRDAGSKGSSRFVAILARDRTQVRLITSYAHGLLPFQASWNRAGSLAIYNHMLHKERGIAPLSDVSESEAPESDAPDWLLTGMCYAEIAGYPVQVLSSLPNPDATLDLLRLEANRPQLVVEPDRSADVAFSDVSQPGITTHWNLHFNRQGDLTSAGAAREQQPANVAPHP